MCFTRVFFTNPFEVVPPYLGRLPPFCGFCLCSWRLLMGIWEMQNIFAKFPRHRLYAFAVSWIPFFHSTLFAASIKTIKGFIHALQSTDLHILWHFAKVGVFFTRNRQLLLLGIARNRLTFSLPSNLAIMARRVLKFTQVDKPMF